MELDVVARGAEPIDVVHIDQEKAIAITYRESRERRQPPIDGGRATGFRQIGPCTLHRLVKPFIGNRLQQEVRRSRLKGFNGISFVRGDTDDDGRPARRALLEHLEPVQIRQLNIQEHQVRLVCPDGSDGFGAGPGLGNNLDVVFVVEHDANALAREGDVIDYERLDHRQLSDYAC